MGKKNFHAVKHYLLHKLLGKIRIKSIFRCCFGDFMSKNLSFYSKKASVGVFEKISYLSNLIKNVNKNIYIIEYSWSNVISFDLFICWKFCIYIHAKFYHEVNLTAFKEKRFLLCFLTMIRRSNSSSRQFAADFWNEATFKQKDWRNFASFQENLFSESPRTVVHIKVSFFYSFFAHNIFRISNGFVFLSNVCMH